MPEWPCTSPANSVGAEEQSSRPHQNAPNGFTAPDSVNQATQSTGTLPLSISLSMERTSRVLLWGLVPKKGGWGRGRLLTYCSPSLNLLRCFSSTSCTRIHRHGRNYFRSSPEPKFKSTRLTLRLIYSFFSLRGQKVNNKSNSLANL